MGGKHDTDYSRSDSKNEGFFRLRKGARIVAITRRVLSEHRHVRHYGTLVRRRLIQLEQGAIRARTKVQHDAEQSMC